MARALRYPEAHHRYRLPATGVESLTVRELQCLYLAALGAANPEIADQLGIALTTVGKRLINAYRKLGVNDRTQAVVAILRYVKGA